MAKEIIEPAKTEEPVEKEKIKEKVEAKVEKVEAKVEKVTGERQNLIGELANPKVDSDFNFKDWAKTVDDRINELLGHYKKKEEPIKDPTKTEEPPKQESKPLPWYEREII